MTNTENISKSKISLRIYSKRIQILCLVQVIFLSVFVAYYGGVNECIFGVITFISRNSRWYYAGNPVEIETKAGIIRGFKSSPKSLSRDGRPFYEFLGIPFAQPPVGELRFEPPVPVQPWEGVRPADAYASMCLQFDPFIQLHLGSEDCLYLNVFTPHVRKSENEPQLPVIVFIHGGLFMFGQAELFRPEYMMDEDVVLVSIQYRLGALGFLNSGDDLVRGNMGLKDQVLALKWIQENIRAFGGNPDLVTLLGESAGGASIHFHMMSNAARGLFHRAVTMSGTALAHWAFVTRPKEQAQIYASNFNCPTNDSLEMVTCLKNADISDIATLTRASSDRLAPKLSIFVPTVESVLDSDTIVSDHPRSLVQNGHVISKVPWLNGVNSEEGVIYAISMLLNQSCIDKLNSEWNRFAPVLFDYENLPEIQKNEVSTKVHQFYVGDANKFVLGDTSVPQFVPLFSDTSFNIAITETTNYHLKHLSNDGPMFLYYYSHRRENAVSQMYFKATGFVPVALDILLANGWRWIKYSLLGLEEKHYGASHADELGILFQFHSILGQITKESMDYNFSKQLIKIWVHFAKTGNPNGSIPDLPNWPCVENGTERKYMNLNSTFALIQEPFTARLKFWKELLGFKKLNL